MFAFLIKNATFYLLNTFYFLYSEERESILGDNFGLKTCYEYVNIIQTKKICAVFDKILAKMFAFLIKNATFYLLNAYIFSIERT